MRVLIPAAIVFALTVAPTVSADEPPLYRLIDSHVSVPDAMDAVCSDAEFLRRVSLDLIGMPPDADRTRRFLADSSPDKRRREIDELIQSPLFDRHIATTLDVMLMERRANTHVPQDDWYRWLHTAVRDNRPWNEVVRDILTADGDDPLTRPAARFFLDRQSEQHLLTRDIGRIFFGRDMQCAQCHDHPLIDDYHQADYHGLLAFVAPGYPVVRKVTTKDGDKETTVDVTVHAEKSGSDLTFSSVFIQESRHRTGPRLLDDIAIDEAFQYPGDEYEVAPAEGVKSVPKFSRRARLAELATDGSSRMFNDNIANRLWAHMLGRGIVHPVDLHHPDNPPTHPELLKLLGERFAAMNYDIRLFLREIALSRTYQRPFDRPDDLTAASAAATEQIARLESDRERLDLAAKSSSAAYRTALEEWQQAEARLLPVADTLDNARKSCGDAKTKCDVSSAALSAELSSLRQKQSAINAVEQAAFATNVALTHLQDDAELTATAATLIHRIAGLAEEIAGLTKSVEETTVVAEKDRYTLNAARSALDAALAGLVPQRQQLLHAEQAMLVARRAMQNDLAALASLDRRLQTVRSVVALAELREKDDFEPVDTAMATLADRWSADFALASLKPLTPEQLCWSVLKVTGVYDRDWKIEETELNRTSPLTDEQLQDTALTAIRKRDIEQRTCDKLKPNVAAFVGFYAAAAGQPQSDFFATADQALFAANGDAMNAWLAPAENNVTHQVVSADNVAVAAEAMYLGVLNRLPTQEETSDVDQWINEPDADRATVARELVWGLLNSIEFRFNH